MANICRICMEACDDLLSIAVVKKEDNEIEILKAGIMFEDSFGIEVTELPDYLEICMGCKIQLTYFYDFKQLALRNHKRLLNLKQTAKNLIDINESVSENNDSCLADAISDNENKIDALVPDDMKKEEVELILTAEDDGNYDLNIEYLEDDLNLFCVMNITGQATESKPDQLEDGNNTLVHDEASLQDDQTEDAQAEILESLEDSYESENMERTKSSSTCYKVKYECEFCGKKFRNLQIFSGHLNVHQGLPAYCCDICGKEFKFKVNYDYHMKNHNNTRSFKCSYCTKSCLSKWDLKMHMRTHLDARPYECVICGKGFRVRSHMTDHMETHNQQNTYECPTCLQKYKTKASLKMHVNTVHLKATQYPCKLCDRVFYRTYHLKIHQKVHMRNMKNS